MFLPNLKFLSTRTLRAALLPLTLLAAFAACGDTNVNTESDRGPLGKADSVGSCEESCGGQSDGNCWCDDLCADYGDCCDDKADVCDAPEPTACGGWLGDTCESDEFCSFTPSAICGFADASGVCAPRPEACITLYDPVCGCNGQTYSNGCMAASAGTSVQKDGACDDPQAKFCGGFANIQCPDGLECIDDPDDDCDVSNGGADCGGICVEQEDCQPVLCELFCSGGFKTDDDGCEICACNDPIGPVDSCEGSCGEQSASGSCWCDDECAGYGDCCGDIEDQCSEAERVPAAGMCVKNSNDECQTDDDCNIGGCGGALCFNPDVSSGIISTCECAGPGVAVSGCGCVEGSCSWYNE
ncbi:MAG: hypothetical protein GY811_22055 [Myxococcales bacterium]|nr:hypothetical protein [Myxococcales bacterium]